MGMLSLPLYVRVSRNQFRLKDVDSGTETTTLASTPFTSTRLLIGQFTAAQQALKGGFKDMAAGRLFVPSPTVLMHPVDMVEGGLSEIEERVLKEVAIGAGAGRVVVWVGEELSDGEVKEKLRGK